MALAVLFLITLCLLFYKLKPEVCEKGRTNVPYKRSIGNAQIKGVKEFQNDYFSVEYSGKYILAVIADGLTDKPEGRYAAETSVNILKENFNDIDSYVNIEEYFKNSFKDINRILNKAQENKTGTAVLAAIVGKNFIEWASIGSCALYLCEDNDILKINGNENNSAEFDKMRLIKKNGILLCTDGVFKSLEEKEMAESMAEKISAYDKSMKMAELIKNKGLKYQDNATLIIIE
jgi:serine/threonine protein phosphatase PrpC